MPLIKLTDKIVNINDIIESVKERVNDSTKFRLSLKLFFNKISKPLVCRKVIRLTAIQSVEELEKSLVSSFSIMTEEVKYLEGLTCSQVHFSFEIEIDAETA